MDGTCSCVLGAVLGVDINYTGQCSDSSMKEPLLDSSYDGKTDAQRG